MDIKSLLYLYLIVGILLSIYSFIKYHDPRQVMWKYDLVLGFVCGVVFWPLCAILLFADISKK